MAQFLSSLTISNPQSFNLRNPNPNSHCLFPKKYLVLHRRNLKVFPISGDRKLRSISRSLPNINSITTSPPTQTLNLHSILLQVSASAILFFVGLGAARATEPTNLPALPNVLCQPLNEEERESEIINGDDSLISINGNSGISDTTEDVEDKELKAMFDKWKSKTFALTVPLRVVALRSSIPPSWIKDFIQSQGKRLKLRTEFRGNLNDIFSDMCSSLSKGNIDLKSAMSADVVSVGDSWLSFGINEGIIEHIQDVETQDWFKGLSKKWQVHLRRNDKGQLDESGKVWAAPYRWGSIVIAYKKNKFRKYNIPPIEDWEDLWRPELAGKISMVDSSREVIGAVLKYMGASYNTQDINSQVKGGRSAALQNLLLLQQQVRLFDSVHYMKAFGVGDVWVAVGWSSDVLPAAKRMSNVAVVVPKSGASLWADLWAIPATSKFSTDRIGGRIRSPSPLIHQWIEFCLQAARALPFQQEIIPGSSPFALEDPQVEAFQDLNKGKPKLDTNLISGVPPSEILAKSEFLEPLSDATIMDYQWLIDNMQKPRRGLINNIQYYISSVLQNVNFKPKLS